jgi:hypothetical protein
MAKKKIEFEVDIPDGWEYVEIRRPEEGEHYLSGYNIHGRGAKVCQADYDFTSGMYPIVRRSQVWKPLTPEKALAFMLARKEVTLRHTSWDKGRVARRTIDQLYFNSTSDQHLSMDLEYQCLVCNVEYLVEGDDA